MVHQLFKFLFISSIIFVNSFSASASILSFWSSNDDTSSNYLNGAFYSTLGSDKPLASTSTTVSFFNTPSTTRFAYQPHEPPHVPLPRQKGGKRYNFSKTSDLEQRLSYFSSPTTSATASTTAPTTVSTIAPTTTPITTTTTSATILSFKEAPKRTSKSQAESGYQGLFNIFSNFRPTEKVPTHHSIPITTTATAPTTTTTAPTTTTTAPTTAPTTTTTAPTTTAFPNPSTIKVGTTSEAISTSDESVDRWSKVTASIETTTQLTPSPNTTVNSTNIRFFRDTNGTNSSYSSGMSLNSSESYYVLENATVTALQGNENPTPNVTSLENIKSDVNSSIMTDEQPKVTEMSITGRGQNPRDTNSVEVEYSAPLQPNITLNATTESVTVEMNGTTTSSTSSSSTTTTIITPLPVEVSTAKRVNTNGANPIGSNGLLSVLVLSLLMFEICS